MKKLAILAIAFIGLTTQAQEKKTTREQLSPEQRVDLQVKKMTLDLDLNEKQQKDMKTLLVKQQQKREEAKAKREAIKSDDVKPTTEQRYAMKSKMLDEQIAHKAEMKKILSEKQMEKWEAQKADRKEHFDGKRKEMRHKSKK
ncbi:hypothetical protein [Flavobacterium sp.]|uniref:hypothetical protein n=1 Tax=Flavobacterium sp. TaxID=239 RepID=UPI0028BD6A8E|nr:hypothetical protein [Flavobacterium sp.]